MKWILFFVLLSTVASAQTDFTTARNKFFRDSFYKGQRDSLLLKSSQLREKSLLRTDSIRGKQIASYKRDSITNVGMFGNLVEQKRVAVDSVVIVKDEKIKKVKKNSNIKGWIIVGLVAVVVGSHL